MEHGVEVLRGHVARAEELVGDRLTGRLVGRGQLLQLRPARREDVVDFLALVGDSSSSR